MAKWELTIYDTRAGVYYGVPVLPIDGKLGYTDGDKQTVSLNIVDLGEVQIPAGVALDSMGWHSLFPAYYDGTLCNIPEDKVREPLAYRNLFSGWKEDGTRLVIICPQAGIQKSMFLTSFSWEPAGAFGDFEYDVKFTEWKDIKPVKLTPGGAKVSSPSKNGTPASRPAAPKAATPKTYTVKSGDTLSAIAKKYGLQTDALYAKNKSKIGTNPNKIGLGLVLTL